MLAQPSEFHVIGNRLYIFHAGTPGPFEKEQSHVMALKPGGNPMRAQDWEMPVRVVRQDGSMLYGAGRVKIPRIRIPVHLFLHRRAVAVTGRRPHGGKLGGTVRTRRTRGRCSRRLQMRRAAQRKHCKVRTRMRMCPHSAG
mgnify:CR=1 FL=1